MRTDRSVPNDGAPESPSAGGRAIRTVSVIALVVVGVIAAVITVEKGLSYYGRHRTFPPDTPLPRQCDDVPDGARRITVQASDGTTLGAASIGPDGADVGVVLRHGASQQICDWLPWAADLSNTTGARILLFDRRGRGSSPADDDVEMEIGDTLVAVDVLRANGTSNVALVGSSIGNAIVFSAAPQLSAPPCAIVSISPVLSAGDSNGRVDASESLDQIPADLWIAWEEQKSGVDSTALDIIARASASQREATPLPVDTDDHSRRLVTNHASVRELISDAVHSCE